MTAHHCFLRVYYEDTDAGGVVYYANYLKFAERARTELLRSHNINQTELAQQRRLLFVVKTCHMELKRPARLDDMIKITTQATSVKAASIILQQNLTRDGEVLAEITVTIACISDLFKPTRLPEDLRQLFADHC